MNVIRWIALGALMCAAACDDLLGPNSPDAPANLTYQLIPSGNSSAPLGVLLSWDIPRSGRANAFNVYARSNGSGWALRGTTTSPSFHDAGTPEQQYYVATRDENGDEVAQSRTVTIDLQAKLPAPQGIGSVSLNGAVQLYWSANSVTASAGTFDHYLVYSTSYDAGRGVCASNWVLEGSTVSDGFLVGDLTNGVSACYVVSAVTHDGHESQWSEARLDTPRPDGRNVIVYARAARPDSSGFLFADEIAKTIGVVANGARADLDLFVDRRADGTVWLTPARAGVTMALYSSTPVSDLTAVDRAPSTILVPGAYQAMPGYAYVFRVQKTSGVHFAALRVAYATSDYVVFDWAYQPAVGNPELNRIPVR